MSDGCTVSEPLRSEFGEANASFPVIHAVKANPSQQMSSKRDDAPTNYANDSQPGPRISVFKDRIHDIEPILDLEGEWRVQDIPGSDQSTNALVNHLTKRGHVEKVGHERSGGKYRNVYEWVEQSKAMFEAYADTLSTLPCGHRAHIPPEAGGDRDAWPCKFCDETHAREVFENRL